MKIILSLLLTSVLVMNLSAKPSSSLKLLYHQTDFSNSTQKEKGKRYGLFFKHHQKKHHVLFSYEKAANQTFKPPLPSNLYVDKIAFKYGYQLSPFIKLYVSTIMIEDNLVATDGGRVYGLGVSYKNFNFSHYFSDYEAFDVHQNELSLVLKNKIGKVKTKTTLLVKHIMLKDHKSNSLSKNAQKTYFTPAMKLYATYDSYIGVASAMLGERTFAVMDRGMKAQHHAMEFDISYALGFGKKISNYTLMLTYNYARATELPRQTENVLLKNIVFSLEKQF